MKSLLKKKLMIVLVFLSLLRIAIAARIPIAINGDETFDDQLLFQYAESILDGKWLGTYNDLTLVKGTSYSFFLVICHLLFLPYTVGLSMLNIGASVTVVKALKKKVLNQNILMGVYLLLIYSPVGFTYLISQRAYRMALIPSMVLMIFGCMLGMFWRKGETSRSIFPWSIGAGVSLSFFWYIREDSIWIAPFVVVILGLMILYALFISREKNHLFRKIAVILIPVGCIACTTFGISILNYHYYGIFATNDRTDTEFGKMMSYLYSIRDDDELDDVWVSNQTVEKAMNASPTLAGARNNIESSIDAWGQGDDIKGDLIAWSIRDAIQTYGYYQDAKSTDIFYHQVNVELQAAFDNGTLVKDDTLHFSSQAAGIKAEKIPELIKSSLVKLLEIANYKECGIKSNVSVSGSDEVVRTVEALTQSFTTYKAKYNYTLTGWVFAKNDTDVLTADLVDENDDIIYTLHFGKSPDVQAAYTEYKHASQCRFDISLNDISCKKVYLNIYINGKLVSHAEPANYDTEKYKGIMEGGLSQQKDSVVQYSQRAVYLGNYIVKGYQKISPLVNLLAAIGYVFLTATIFFGMIRKKYQHLDVWLGITGVFLSAFVLMFGIEFFCSWFGKDMQKYLSFYAAGTYYLVQMAKYMAIMFGIPSGVYFIKGVVHRVKRKV